MISFCIYVLAGREIFRKRKQLRAFSNPSRPVPVRIENPFTSFKTTEIHITSELATLQSPNTSNLFAMPDKKKPDITDRVYDQYSVMIGSAPMSPRSEAPPPMTPRAHSTIAQRNNRAAMEANRAAFGYTKVALLFFVSLLVTWVSSHTCPSNQIQITHPAYETAGPFLDQPSLFPYPPFPRFPSFHVCLRHRPSFNGLLELRHLHHNVLGRRATVV